MKVIDLLNKIANGEVPPAHIKINDYDWYYYDTKNTYGDKKSAFIVWDWYVEENKLNDEVEIIEEPQEHKIPEKLNTWYGIKPVKSDSPTTFKDNAKYIDYNTEMFFDKINEILDYLEVNNDGKR